MIANDLEKDIVSYERVHKSNSKDNRIIWEIELTNSTHDLTRYMLNEMHWNIKMIFFSMREGKTLNNNIALTKIIQIISHEIIRKFQERWGICHHLSICN